MERLSMSPVVRLGPIARNESRQQVVSRLLELMREAKACGSDIVVFPELALTTFLSALVDGRRSRDRQLLRARNAEPGDAAAVRSREIARHRLLSRLCRTGEGERRRRTATTPRSWWTRTRRSSANTARCICPATPTIGRTIRFSIWRSAISSRAISAFRSGAPSAATSACASATIGAGRRPIASWECRASS